MENRFRFNGQQYDPITQQYYLRARYYNPVIARFTQEDTYRGDGLNLYTYCRNNPVSYVDPSGHWCDQKEQVYQDLLKKEGLTADTVDPDTQLRLMAEAANQVRGKISAEPNGSGDGSAKQPDFIGSDNGLTVPIDVYNMSTPDFIQYVADIANQKINEKLIGENRPTTGHVAGSLKHHEAAEIVRDYQLIIPRGLEVEIPYLGGNPTRRRQNLSGCVRLDVFDTNTNQVYDYKFVVNPGRGLSKTQINKILRIGPRNLTQADIHEINPR